jgi:hypothetical protein
MPSGPASISRQERIEALCERVLWAALCGMAAGLAYLVYAVGSSEGFVATFRRFPQAEQLAIFDRLRVACQLLTYSAWIALAALAVRSWHAPEWGYVPLIGGGLCQLALPQLLRFALLQQGGSASPASWLIVTTFRDVGSAALIVGSVLAGRDLFERLTARRLRARIAASRATSPPRVRNLPLDEKQDRFLGKCWELPMCRPAIRRSCPVFIRDKQPCWRIGVGCMCSEEVLFMAARNRGEDLTHAGGQGAAWKPQLMTLEQLAKRLTPRQKRERCMNCSIYLHHQAQKYRALLPVVIAGVVAISAALLPLFHRGYVAFANAADEFAAPLSMKQAAGSEVHPALRDWSGHLAEAHLAEWILFACLGIVLVSYALHALEYAITRRGW